MLILIGRFVGMGICLKDKLRFSKHLNPKSIIAFAESEMLTIFA